MPFLLGVSCRCPQDASCESKPTFLSPLFLVSPHIFLQVTANKLNLRNQKRDTFVQAVLQIMVAVFSSRLFSGVCEIGYLVCLFTLFPASLVVASGIYFPDQGLNPGPLHWEFRVLATGPSGTSPQKTSLIQNLKFSFSDYYFVSRICNIFFKIA